MSGEVAMQNSNVENRLKHWSVAIILMVCVVLAFFDKISIAVLFKDAGFLADLGIGSDKAKLGLLMTSFLLAYGFSSMFLSFIGDLISPKKLLLGSVTLWGLLMLAMGMTHSFAGLIILRILLGIAEGPLFALAYSMVKKIYNPREQARASTLFLLGTPIGASLGFPITAYVLAMYNWQATFFVMAALTIVVLLLIIFGLRHVDLSKATPTQAKTQGSNFSLHLSNTKTLFLNFKFWILCVFNIALMSYLWGLNSWVPNYLMENKGFDLKTFGTYSSLPFLAMLTGEILGALYADKSGKRAKQVFAGLFVAGVSMYLMIAAHSPMMVILAMSISAFSWGVSVSAVFALLASVTSAEVSATAGGIFNGLGNFASAIVPLAIGIIVQSSSNFNYGIATIALIAIIGSFLLLPLLVTDRRATAYQTIKEK
jgi:sugar phosphate permease